MNKQKIKNSIFKLLNTPYTTQSAVLTILSIILVRLLIETWIAGFIPRGASFYFYEFLHTTSFFVLFFIICVFLLTKIAKISRKTSLTIMLFAFVLIIIPPIIDKIIVNKFFNGVPFMSYYLFDSVQGLTKSFFTFFGDRPHDGITYGTRVMIFMALVFFMILTWLKTKQVLRVVAMGFISYTIFFLMSSVPSLITYLTFYKHLESSKVDVASIIASPSTILANQIPNPISAINTKMSLFYILIGIILILYILYRTHKKIFISLLKNIRPIQSIYHIGLLIIGMCIALAFANAVLLPSFFTTIAFLLLCIAIIFAWYSTVIFNDCVDQKIDTISNPTRPLITGVIDITTYKKIGITLVILSILITTAVSAYATPLLIAYHALSYLYNTPPLRLKKFPLIGTFVAALASFFVVLIGFITIAPTHSLNNFPPSLAMLLIVSYTISLPIKDLKDIEGDKANNIYTIPAIFGQKVGRIIIATGIFISLILSVLVLGTKILTLPALLAGSIIFWILVGTKKDSFIFSPIQTIAFTFIIISLYAVLLVFSFFL